MDKKQGPFKPGDQFKDWVIQRLIGSGGHAYVYEAQNAFTRTDVAIKIIPSPRDSGRDLVERARSEARVLARIQHENVVRVTHASVTEDGLVYLVMDLLSGRDLRKAINQHGRLSVAEVLTIIRQVSAGVGAAHRQGAIHRDLKPENIFIEQENRVKVLDFGVAKVMGYGAQTTEKDLLHGTVLYMSPEQLKGFGVTARSDIFALGTIAYEALHGHPALLGNQVPSFEQIGWAQIERQPPLLNQLDPSIPSYVARFVDKAIMKNPEQRFQSIDEMSTAARDAFDRYAKDAKGSLLFRPLWEAHGPAQAQLPEPPDTDVVTRPPFSAPPESVRQLVASEVLAGSAGPRQAEPQYRAPALSLKPDSASQLTPPPTTSGIRDDAPVAVAGATGRRRLVPLVVGSAAVVGLSLGAGIMWRGSSPKHSAAEDTAATASAVTSTIDRERSTETPAVAKPRPSAILPPTPPAASAALAPAPAPATESPRAPEVALQKPAAVPRASASPPATAAAKPKQRSEMEERMQWLDQDLKPKAAPAVSSKKLALPSSGLD